jgi:hypothetical protein
VLTGQPCRDLLAANLLPAKLSGCCAAYATADGCAVVLKTPDGILNVRKAPTANAEIVAKLKQGDVLNVDTAQCETRADLSICSEGTRWTQVTSVPRRDGNSAAPTQGEIATSSV